MHAVYADADPTYTPPPLLQLISEMAHLARC